MEGDMAEDTEADMAADITAAMAAAMEVFRVSFQFTFCKLINFSCFPMSTILRPRKGEVPWTLST